MGFFVFIFWAGLAGIIALAASSRGRNPFAWFLVALFLSPLIAALFLLFLGPNSRPCPQCGEAIKRAAKVCRFCGATIVSLRQKQS